MRTTTLLLLGAALALAATALLATAAAADGDDGTPVPMVDPPTSYGPYAVGYTYHTIRTSTNDHDTYLKAYYPATAAGRDAAPDASSAPYPAILWLPGTGGTRESYQGYLSPLCSWGFVVVAVGYNHNYFPSSCDPSDVNEFLDWLERCDSNSSHLLGGMVDEDRFGLSGHSAGGGLSLWNGAYVGRVKAVQTLAAAIATASVPSLVPYFDKPLLLQAGDQDTSYTPGSDAVWRQFECSRSYLRIIGGTHSDGFQGDTFFSFFLYYLSGVEDYREFVYGDHVINRSLAGVYDLYIHVNETGEFYPPRVEASVAPSDVDMDETVLFNGTILGRHLADDPRGSFEWDFDDDSYDVSSPTELDHGIAFTEVVELNVTFRYTIGRFSTSAPATMHVSVRNVRPAAAFTHGDLTVQMDAEVGLDASATSDTPSDAGSLEYMWDTGDGELPEFTSAPTLSHVYMAPGTYLVTLLVTDRHGASSIAQVNVTVVNVAPTAAAPEALGASEDETVELDGTGQDTPTDARRLRYQWDFGDGMGTDWEPSGVAHHSYARSGIYTATLSVKDPQGALASANVTVTVANLAPSCEVLSPGSSPVSVDEDAEVPFRGGASDTPTDADGLSHMWDFGDGAGTEWAPVRDMAASHAYTRSGTYTAVLRVVDDDGAEATAEVTVEVANLPPTVTMVRPAAYIDVDEDSTVVFDGEARDTPSDVADLALAWDVDGTPLEGGTARLELVFRSSGTHIVRLTVTDGDGAAANASVEVTVRNLPPEVDATVAPLAITEGESVNFSAVARDTPTDEGALELLWDLGDGATSSAASGNHTYGGPGNYTVTLTVTDDDGERAMRTFKVTVDAAPPPPPPPPVDDGGDDGPATAFWAGVTAAVVVVLVVVAFLLLPRLRGGRGDDAQR